MNLAKIIARRSNKTDRVSVEAVKKWEMIDHGSTKVMKLMAAALSAQLCSSFLTLAATSALVQK